MFENICCSLFTFLLDLVAAASKSCIVHEGQLLI